jgi:phosphoribosylformylglycinamidine synthase
LLFSESNSRFLCEVSPEQAAGFEAEFSQQIPHAQIGVVRDDTQLVITSDNVEVISASIDSLKEAWQRPLRY